MNQWMMDQFLWGEIALSLCFGGTCAWIFFGLTARAPWVPPEGGMAGLKRSEAREQLSFRLIEPFLLRLASFTQWAVTSGGRVAPRLFAPLLRFVAFQTRLLRWAGHPAGLSVWESLGLAFVLGGVGAVLGFWLGVADATLVGVLPGALIFAVLPTLRLRGLATERFLEMGRELPAAIDLTALAMGAGCDFPSAVRRVVEGQSGVVADELRQLLFALDLGMTRKTALLALEDRVPVDEVRDLVRAIILAEEKGSTVKDALTQQAHTSRARRSVRAEEAAARAGTLLVLPLMLLMGSIVVLLFGPLVMESNKI